jgi:hypothetical protein
MLQPRRGSVGVRGRARGELPPKDLRILDGSRDGLMLPRRVQAISGTMIGMPVTVDVVTNSAVDWAAIAAAGATVIAAVGGIWGTSRQAKHARDAATADLKRSLEAAQENLRLSIAADNERERVAEKNRAYDAAEQRITELYSKAVEQLGHGKAPVRLGGLYALERLANDNIEHRQTVVDVVCAYLRMPFDAEFSYVDGVPSDGERYQELQVRIAAQNLLVRHLVVPMVLSKEKGVALAQPSKPPRSYWKNISLDLKGALLVNTDFTLCVLADVDLTGARFKGAAMFGNTRFEGESNFVGTRFYDDANFGQARFELEGTFHGAEFFGSAQFHHTTYGLHGFFEDAKFRGETSFNQAVFEMGAIFRSAEFYGAAHFRDAYFGGVVFLDTAEFKGDAPDFSGSTVGDEDHARNWPPQWGVERPAAANAPSRVVWQG